MANSANNTQSKSNPITRRNVMAATASAAVLAGVATVARPAPVLSREHLEGALSPERRAFDIITACAAREPMATHTNFIDKPETHLFAINGITRPEANELAALIKGAPLPAMPIWERAARVYGILQPGVVHSCTGMMMHPLATVPDGCTITFNWLTYPKAQEIYDLLTAGAS